MAYGHHTYLTLGQGIPDKKWSDNLDIDPGPGFFSTKSIAGIGYSDVLSLATG